MNIPGVSEEYVNLLRNRIATDEAIPIVYRTIIDWGCTKDQSDTFETHVLNTGTDVDKKWAKKQSNKLQKTHMNDYDVTFLNELLPVVCASHIFKPGTTDWKTKMNDQTSVEYLLKKLKDFRNTLTHEYEEAKQNSLFDQVRDVMIDCLNSAGTLYSKQQSDIDVAIQEVRDKFTDIINSIYDKKKRINFIAQIMSTDGKSEIADIWKCRRKVALPSSLVAEVDRDSIFHHIKLSYMDYLKNHRVQFVCDKIFDVMNQKYLVVHGVPGSGKTTFFRIIMEKWSKVGTSSWTFLDIEKYDLLVFIECRTDRQIDIGSLLKKNMPKTLVLFPEEEVLCAVLQLKTLVVVDGFDECNNESLKLVMDVIDTCQANVNMSLIISTRPHAGKSLSSELSSKGIQFEVLAIEDIGCVDEQVEFIERFQTEMCGVKAPEMTKAFVELPVEVRLSFVHPVFLALFCFLYRESNKSMLSWKNQGSVLEAVYDLIKSKMSLKIKDFGQFNSDMLAEDIMNKICKLSLRLFQSKMFFLNKREYSKFCKECYKEFGGQIEYEHLLSCIFATEYSVSSKPSASYQFFHSSLQEYCAARFIVEELTETTPDPSSVQEVVAAILGVQISQEDLSRYGNVLKFIILDLICKDELQDYSNIVSQSMKDFKPNYVYSTELIASSDNCEDVAELLVPAIVTEDRWFVDSIRKLKPTTLLLRVCMHPPLLWVELGQPIKDDRTFFEFLESIRDHYEGHLKMSLAWHQKMLQPTDKYLKVLFDSRFKLDRLTTCVESADTIESVMAMQVVEPPHYQELSFSVPSVVGHKLHLLHGTGALYLRFHVRYTMVHPPQLCAPLVLGQRGRPPYLFFDNIPSDGLPAARAIILMLAPENKMFRELRLLQCGLSEDDLQELISDLQRAGIRTAKYNAVVDDGPSYKWLYDWRPKELCCTGCYSDVNVVNQCEAHLQDHIKCWRFYLTDYLSEDDWAAELTCRQQNDNGMDDEDDEELQRVLQLSISEM